MEDEYIGENASELINRLSRQLEHARDFVDIFNTFIDIDTLNISDDIKKIMKTKLQVIEDDRDASN